MDFSGLIASYRPPSAVEEDVLETLHKDTTPFRQHPLRRLADHIIRGMPSDLLRDSLMAEDVCLDEPVHKGLRLVHYAVFQDAEDTLLLLLELGADPNVMDDVGFTPVHLCAEKGYCRMIEILISYGARIRFTELQPDDQAFGDPPRACAADEPLRLAIKNCEHEAARLLLENGANPSAVYYLGEEICVANPADSRSVELLLLYGADPNARDFQGLTPLMKACRNTEAVETVHILISYGADVNAQSTDDHRTPLHYAVLTGNLEGARALVGSGASVRFPREERTRPPPLFHAVLRGDLRVLRFLLDSGADVNAPSVVVGSALHLSLTEKVENQLEVVRELLGRGADPNAITLIEGRPAMKPPIGEYLQNCEHPRLDVIRLMLRYGAQIVLRGQRDHPLGILKVIHRIHLGMDPEVFFLLLDASDSFDVSFVEQSRQMSDDQKRLLLDRALQPFSLLHAARLQLRRSIGWGPAFLETVQGLPIPRCLRNYVLFDE